MSEVGWKAIEDWFESASRNGLTSRAIELLEDLQIAERFRPLHEALLATSQGSRDALLAAAPEVRLPAERLFDRFNNDDGLMKRLAKEWKVSGSGMPTSRRKGGRRAKSTRDSRSA